MIDPAALRLRADACDAQRLAGDRANIVTLIHLALHLRKAADFMDRLDKDTSDARRN